MGKIEITFRQILNTYKEVLYTFLSILIVGILTPLLLLFCIPIYCFRWGVKLSAKLFRPDLADMLEARSTGMGTEDVYKSPNATLLITAIIEGSLTREYACDRFQNILKMRRDNGKLKYSQLYQHLTKWMGFLFWTPDADFDIKHHVKYITLNEKNQIVENNTNVFPEINGLQLKEIEKRLIQSTFTSNRSPWEFVILKNFKPSFAKEGVNYQICMLRVHHSLGDGYGILKMLLLDFCGADKDILRLPEFPKPNYMAQTLLHIYAAIRAPFDIMSHLLWSPDQNGLHLPSNQLYGNQNFHIVESDRIPLESLRVIKKRYGAAFNVVVFAACTSAIRSFMLKREIPVPEIVTSMVPFPINGHPNKMGNYWSAMMVNFPVGIPCPQLRLQYIKNHMKELRHSTAALTAFKIQPLIGGLFHWMVKPLASLVHPTALSSDFPGPKELFSNKDFTIVDAHWIGGFPSGNVGLLFFSMSYAKSWKMNLLVDHGIASSDAEVEELMGYLLKELSNLQSETTV